MNNYKDITHEDKIILETLKNPNFSFIETFGDASDTSKVTREMTVLLFKHRKARELLKEKEREKVKALNQLKRKQREEYIKNENAPNQAHRKILVEIACEDLEWKVDILDQQIKELNRTLNAIKIEIDTWKAISYSLRTEMGSF